LTRNRFPSSPIHAGFFLFVRKQSYHTLNRKIHCRHLDTNLIRRHPQIIKHSRGATGTLLSLRAIKLYLKKSRGQMKQLHIGKALKILQDLVQNLAKSSKNQED